MERKISVVIPTFRRPHLLKNCIAALCAQNIPQDDYEIVVVSDGPDEATRALLNDLHVSHPFIQFIALARKAGPAAARNAGWRASSGAVIAFTDDDCVPAPDWLSRIWSEHILRNEPQFIAYTGIVVVPLPEKPTDFELNTSHLQDADFVTANCACTKEALQLVGGFDERFTAAWREDSDLEFRLLMGNVEICRKISAVVVHPVRKVPWGASIREQKKTMFNALLYKKFPDLYRQKIQAAPAWNYYAILGGAAVFAVGAVIGSAPLMLTGAAIYLTLTAAFAIRRLLRTSRSSAHVVEMLATSAVIPFLSVYWTWVGALKYRVLYY